MFSALLRKKLSSNQFSNIFINAIFDATDKGFEYVCELINTDPAFISSPNVKTDDINQFQLIILSANYKLLENYFEPQQVAEVKEEIIQKLSAIYEVDNARMGEIIHQYVSYIGRINFPSKNMIYGISKAIFHKYNLSGFQDEYFRRMQTPNPLFLKRLDHLIENYVWDWEVFIKKYRI